MGYISREVNEAFLHTQITVLLQKMDKPKSQPNNPLHGIKLADMLEYLVEEYGWKELGSIIKIRCFNNDPTIKSSLKFLRKTEWARTEVEEFYLYTLEKKNRQGLPR